MASKEIKYGIREGEGHGKEYPVAATQYLQNRGGHFVHLVSGAVTLCASGAVVVGGWADVPKQTAGQNSWASSSTAKKDKVFVITGLEDVFEMPYYGHTASPNATLVGRNVGIINATTPGVNCTVSATSKQYAKGGGAALTSSPLTVVDFDRVNKTVFVKIDPVYKQAI